MRRAQTHGGVNSQGKPNQPGQRQPSQLNVSQKAIIDAAQTIRTLLPIGTSQKHTGRYLSYEHAGIDRWLRQLESWSELDSTFPAWIRRGTVAEAISETAMQPSSNIYGVLCNLREQLRRLQKVCFEIDPPNTNQSPNRSDCNNSNDSNDIEPRGRLAKWIIQTRILYGWFLEETACQLWIQWRERAQSETYMSTSEIQNLQSRCAQLMHASACAATWTSTHAHVLRVANFNKDDGAYASSHTVRYRGKHAVDASDSQINMCTEVPLDWEPNLATPLNQFSETCSSAAFSSQIPLGICSKGQNVMQQLLARSINPASRGWSSSLQSAMKKELAVQTIVKDSFIVCMNGLHSAIDPTVRPNWQERAKIDLLLRPIINECLSKDTRALAEVIKDVMRRTLAYNLHHELPVRAAMASLNMQASQLTHPPEAMASSGLMNGMKNVIKIAKSMVTSMEMYFQGANTSNPISFESVMLARLSELCRQTSVSTWVGRVKPLPTRVLVVKECASLFMQGFQARFVPFWVHSVRKSARAQRLDHDQYDGIHRHNSVLHMANALDESHILAIQRCVLRQPSACLMTLKEALVMIAPLIDDLLNHDERQLLRRLTSPSYCINEGLLISLPSVILSAVLQFGSVASLCEQVKVVELGRRTQILHILVLANTQHLLTVEHTELIQKLMHGWNDEDVLKEITPQVEMLRQQIHQRPVQTWSMCACMECRRVANAMHQSDPKITPKRASSNAKPTDSRPKSGAFYEVGIVAAMNDPSDPSKLYCAKRPSAALKTALLSVRNATRMAIDRQPYEMTGSTVDRIVSEHEEVEEEEENEEEEDEEGGLPDTLSVDSNQHTTCANKRKRHEGNKNLAEDATVQSSHSRMRRDTKRCYEQRRMAEACGTHAMLSIDCIGRAIHIMGEWFTMCTFCGVIMRCTSGAQIGCHLACSTCHCAQQKSSCQPYASTEDALLSSIFEEISNEAEKNTVQLSVGVRTASRLRERESDKTCRFCNSVSVRRGRGFVAYHSPHDRRGVNEERPPALRITRWCPKHNRSWLKEALKIMPTNIVLAHILMHAKPVNV